MFTTLMKILPVLWPFFKEMVLGGKKDPEATEKPTRLKALFYVIAFLLIALGYGASEALNLFQKLHTAELQNATLLSKAEGSTAVIDNLKAEKTTYQGIADDRYNRIKELRDIERDLSKQLMKVNTELQNISDEKTELQRQNKELGEKLAIAEEAARNLGTFKVNPATPKRLLKHNQAVDVLKQLKEESANDNRR